jgi:hypothetical protein
MTDRAAWWAPANGFQPRFEPRVHLATRKIHASQRSGKRCRKRPTRAARRLVTGAIAAAAPSFAAAEVEALASWSGEEGPRPGRRHWPVPRKPAGSAVHGSARRPCARTAGAGAGPVPSPRYSPGTAEGCPSRRHGGPPRPRQWESPVGSPVFKLWNESRTNRARIADSIHVGFRSRPHIVADRSPTTKSCNRTDTIAGTRASTR